MFAPQQRALALALLIAYPLAAHAADAADSSNSSTAPSATNTPAPEVASRALTVVAAAALAPAPAASGVSVLGTVQITEQAHRLNDARTGIQTQTGASVYTIDAAAIAAMPAGDNGQLNQVLLQAPDVAQDSFGQFHVRGEHADLQYRLDGVILPEGISVFGQSMDPRLISSISLVTGALPSEYGLRTSGVIDIKTKEGDVVPGGTISLYGGSHGTVQPSISYGGTAGQLHYFVSADTLSSDLGIESPDGSSNPLHDHTHQTHAFGYLEYILDPDNRISAAVGSSVGNFQIPNQASAQPSLGLDVNGQTTDASADLNESQREITQFGFISFQHSDGPLDWQTSLVSRYSSLNFTPDAVGDLLFNGISQAAYKRNQAVALQSDAAYKLNATHTLRAGLFLQQDTSTSLTSSQVLPLDANGAQITDVPETLIDNGSQTERIESLYAQDEWSLTPTLTVNYGLRFDHYTAYGGGQQLSPRLNMVWKAAADTTLHAGYSSYFSPPPFELVGNETLIKFANTSAAPLSTLDDTPKAESAKYLDIGADHDFGSGFTAGIDAYYKRSKNLIDEGQFGAPIILTPFNYAQGKQYGEEFKFNYAGKHLSVYGNLAFQTAVGRQIDSAQFNFSAEDLAYISTHYIDLDHEQKVTASAGASYLWGQTRFSADALLGSGLRADLALPDGSDIPNGAHLPYYTQVNLGVSHRYDFDDSGALTLRFDVINALDRIYEIRNGTGVGVGAPQFGPRRGFFFGISKEI